MNPTRLDHLVLGTDDLDRTAEQIETRTGVRPVEGGRHDGLGTRNLLASLGAGAYLEVIGPDAGQGIEPQWFGLDRLRGTRLITWAVATTNLPDAAQRLRDAGTDPGVVRSMSRCRPDGSVLSWRLTHVDPLPLGGTVPFLIDWGGCDHPSQADLPQLSLSALRLAGPDRPAMMRALHALELEQTWPVIVEQEPDVSIRARVTGPRGEMTM